MATQNPIEMEGTYPLPEAQLDRFLFKALVPFPSADDLMTVVARTTGADQPVASAVCDAAELRAMIALTREVPVPEHVVRHAVDLVIGSHPKNGPERIARYVRFGSSPRGVQAMILAGKAKAVIDGRPSVSIDDVRSMATAALRHRLVLGYEATADAVEPDDLVADVLDAVPAPTSGIRGAP